MFQNQKISVKIIVVMAIVLTPLCAGLCCIPLAGLDIAKLPFANFCPALAALITGLLMTAAALIGMRLFVKKPLKRMEKSIINAALGKLDDNIELPKVKCSDIRKCNKPDCSCYDEEVHLCFLELGSYATELDKEVKCPSILKGKFKTCEECAVTQKMVNNEFNRVAAWLNLFKNDLFVILKTVDKTMTSSMDQTQSVAASVEETAATTTQIARNIQSVNTNVNEQFTLVERMEQFGKEENELIVKDLGQLSEAEEKMQVLNDMIMQQNTRISEIGSAITEMTSAVKEVSSLSSSTMEAFNKFKEISDHSRQLIEDTASNTENLLNSIQIINNFVGIITGVASQTNLLAMNAAIEAAHAGDVGRGFAVVAEEIRTLAEQSNSQAESAKKSLIEIEESINSTAKDIHMSEENFNKLSSELQVIDENMTSVKSAAEQQHEGIQEIQQASSGLEKISSSVKDEYQLISSSLGHTHQNLQKLMDMSKSAEDTMGSLKQLSTEITAAMNEMGVGAQQLNSAAGDMNMNISSLNDNSQKAAYSISAGMRRFKENLEGTKAVAQRG